MIKYYLQLTLFMLLFMSKALAQSNETYLIDIQPIYNDLSFLLEQKYPITSQDSIQFDVLKFYISNVVLLSNDQPVWTEEESYHLIDYSKKNTLQLPLETPSDVIFNQIKFNLVVFQINIVGYSFFNFILASAEVNCQSIPFCFSFRLLAQV